METKKEKIISAVATIGIILTLFGATYAYFISRSDAGKTTDIEIAANTVDVFSFETGDLISIGLDQESFASGTGDKTGSTYAKATLIPNNKTNTATDNYYVYLNISNNTFSYSLGSDKPEILLQVMDADGATVKSLDGLTYSTVINGAGESVSGFDITTKTGLITLANDKEITANTTTKEETWNITVIFVNYNENQADNAGNDFKAKLVIQKEKYKPTLAEWIKTQYTTQGDNNLYYHDSTLENGAGDNSYRYAGVHDDVNNFVCFGSNEETCPNDKLYRVIGVFEDQVKLIKWDYITSKSLGENNYVVYYDEDLTTYENYYKGLETRARGYFSVLNTSNSWHVLELYSVLNTTFLSVFDVWSDKIITMDWKIGENSANNITRLDAKTAYNSEIINPVDSITYNAKIGLIYVSDYYYSATETFWKSSGYDLSGNDYSKATDFNWMYMGLPEWTSTRNSWDIKSNIFIINEMGFVDTIYYERHVYEAGYLFVRPTFYLNPDVRYVSGSGSKDSPIRIN